MHAVLCKVTLRGARETLRGVGFDRPQTARGPSMRPTTCPPPATSSAPPPMRYSFVAPRRRTTLSLPAPMPTDRGDAVWLDETELVELGA